jgi:hypothetical protein
MRMEGGTKINGFDSSMFSDQELETKVLFKIISNSKPRQKDFRENTVAKKHIELVTFQNGK